MTGDALQPVDILRIVRSHFAHRVSNLMIEEDGSVRFVVFDAFTCVGVRDDYGSGRSWGFGLVLPGGVSLVELLGERITLRERPEQVIAALTLVDRYVRLRLGAEYVEVFDATHLPVDQSGL
ncbi:MAG: hypothetical protein QM572_00110 [Nocardioides sp.]|uniref:hypothetical protein n=1 Tax=Nocardioides sp. TaxID=35761 RepID=UPI0039E2BA4F